MFLRCDSYLQTSEMKPWYSRRAGLRHFNGNVFPSSRSLYTWPLRFPLVLLPTCGNGLCPDARSGSLALGPGLPHVNGHLFFSLRVLHTCVLHFSRAATG